jgi:ABC-type nitrate/sulfonate/bicarbonate transport system ATPase subunit
MTMTPANLIEVHDLWRAFPDQRGGVTSVVEGVSFSLAEGTITSLLGASGCGKTTLLRLVAGLDTPDRGRVSSALELPGPRLGYVPQGERLLPWRTVLENVALAGELLGTPRKEAESLAAQALADVGLIDVAQGYPSQISGGMTQRALLARTFLTKPRLLLLDEPLGQLDIIARRDLAAIIQRYVRANHAAALIVTHSVEEAVSISDTILTLSRRPAMITERFVLSMQSPGQGEKLLNSEGSYEVVQRALLRALEERGAR